MKLPALLPNVLFPDLYERLCPIVPTAGAQPDYSETPLTFTKTTPAFDRLEPDGPTWS